MLGSTVVPELRETVNTPPHSISIVIPVYQGEKTLAAVINEILPMSQVTVTPDGNEFVVSEVLLVYDNGPDESDRVMRELEREHAIVQTVWLSRNFGQHAATLAGMASSGSDWIVTLDEDGQHDPAEMATMLDTALSQQADVVYAKPTNVAPHGFFRNAASKSAKWVLTKVFGNSNAPEYQSYRLILGSIGRSVAAYSGSGVYLDVAMGWVASRIVTSPAVLREEGDRRSGYSLGRLLSHFRRMVVSTGTRGLRLVTGLGVIVAAIGVVMAVFVLIERLTGSVDTEGWASIMVVLLLTTGAVLFSLGIIAEYIGVNVNMAMGKPPYLITSDPANGPLQRGRRQPR